MLAILPGTVLADDVLITEIVVDLYGSESVLIRGENLCDNKGDGNESVTLRLPDSANELSKLGCYEAGSAGNSLDELSVLLPNDLERGTYLLTVDNGNKIGFMGFAYGAAALDGEQGPAGEKGEKGEAGPQGIQGEEGPAGKDGLVGATGEKGPPGVQGPQGEQGEIGVGLMGPTGNTGEKGPTGDMGPPGLAGEGCAITQCGVGDTSATMSCPGSTDVEIPCPAEDLATQLQRTCYDAGGTWDAGTRTCTAASNYNCFLGGYCTAVETYFTVNGWTSQWTSIYTGHTEWTEPKCALEEEEKAQWRQGQRYAEYSINNVEAIRQEWLNDGQVCGNRCRLPALVESIACGGL